MNAETRLLAATATLLVGAAAVVLASAPRDGRAAQTSAEFQTAVGGLGLGTALVPSPCGRGFDPRLETTCRGRVDPFAAGDACCARHRSLLPRP